MSNPFEPIKPANIDWHEGVPFFVLRGDCYNSKKRALEERLESRLQKLADKPTTHFVIAETRFGCGLNFLLTWALWQQYAPQSATLHYFASEDVPLTSADLARCLAFWPQLADPANELLASYPMLTPGFHHLKFAGARINLTIMLGEATKNFQELLVCGDPVLEPILRDFHVDMWIQDERNESLLPTIAMLSRTDTFNISPGYHARPKRQTPWHVSTPSTTKGNKRALVLGAGLAGCYVAHALASRGWSVTLVDEAAGIGQGASGNSQAILYPQLSAFRSPLNEFMLTAYLFAKQAYQTMLRKHPIGELSGILQLAYNHKELVAQSNLQQWLRHYPDLGRQVDAEQASKLAGITLRSGGLFIPDSGWIDTPVLCQFLLDKAKVNYVANTPITSLIYSDGQWHANEHHADVLVVTTGYRTGQFVQTSHLPLKVIRGQMTSIRCNEESARLQIPLCGAGHVLPARGGTHDFGATYQSGVDDQRCFDEDDANNLKKLGSLPTSFAWSNQIVGHWAGVRAATPDYLPLVGAVADAELLKQQYQGLASNSKRWIPAAGIFHQGLYVCAGFGSRGLTSIPLCAEWLAATINQEPGFLSRKMVQSLSPARFIIRSCSRIK